MKAFFQGVELSPLKSMQQEVATIGQNLNEYKKLFEQTVTPKEAKKKLKKLSSKIFKDAKDPLQSLKGFTQVCRSLYLSMESFIIFHENNPDFESLRTAYLGKFSKKLFEQMIKGMQERKTRRLIEPKSSSDQDKGNNICMTVIKGGFSYVSKHYAQLKQHRFHKEPALLLGLKHPNIISIGAVLNTDAHERPVYALPYYPLKDLFEVSIYELKTKQLFFFKRELARYAKGLVSALEYLHEKGIVHCDVKRENSLVGKGKEAVLIDPDFATKEGTSRKGGTKECFPPEEKEGQPITNKVDIWAFGILLAEYLTSECLSEKKPFPPNWNKRPWLKAKLKELDPKGVLRWIIQECSQSDPSKRPTATMLLRKLNEIF